jgi:hypothetical protein
MELAVEPADFPYLPQPLSLAHAITVATMRATGIIPYAYQVRCAEALYLGATSSASLEPAVEKH